MADLIDRDALLHDMTHRGGLGIGDWHVFDVINEQQAVNRWIPCSEALPASICRVLVTTYAGNVGIAVFNPEKKRWYKNGEFYDLCLIIAWQPMPDAYEPPEKE